MSERLANADDLRRLAYTEDEDIAKCASVCRMASLAAESAHVSLSWMRTAETIDRLLAERRATARAVEAARDLLHEIAQSAMPGEDAYTELRRKRALARSALAALDGCAGESKGSVT